MQPFGINQLGGVWGTPKIKTNSNLFSPNPVSSRPPYIDPNIEYNNALAHYKKMNNIKNSDPVPQDAYNYANAKYHEAMSRNRANGYPC